MNCRRIDVLLSTALDEALPPREQAEVDAHLATCPACVRRLKGYGVTVQVLKGLRAIEQADEPPPVPENLVARILAARSAAAANEDQGRRIG